jgi:hypothetical protein
MNSDTVRTRLLPAVVLLAAALLLSGRAADCRAGEKKGPVYKTPEDVYKAAAKAMKNRDMKLLCAVLTPDSRAQTAGQLTFIGLLIKGFTVGFAKDDEAKEKARAKFKPLDEAMAKHGLTEEAMKALEPKAKKMFGDKVDFKTLTDEQKGKLLRLMVSPVKDHCAYLMDLVAALDKLGTKRESLELGELKELKIEGDSARGMAVVSAGGTESTRPIEFRRRDGSWLIELPLQFLEQPGKKGGGAPPAK